MERRPWTVQEEAALAMLAYLGAEQVALVLGRPRDAVKKKANRLGVSVRKTSEINVTVLSPEAIRRIRERDPGILCPACGRRLAVPATGICGVCHKQALTQVHRERVAELQAQRDYNQAKQEFSRLRRRVEREGDEGTREVG